MPRGIDLLDHSKHYINLKMPYVAQGPDSGNCGPCSLKMICDYFSITKNDGRPYSVPSLNRLCRVTRQWGAQARDLNRALTKIGLKRTRVNLNQVEDALLAGVPVLSVFIDESGGGHYAVVKGEEWCSQEQEHRLIFHDPLWGPNLRRPKELFERQCDKFDHWLYALSASESTR